VPVGNRIRTVGEHRELDNPDRPGRLPESGEQLGKGERAAVHGTDQEHPLPVDDQLMHGQAGPSDLGRGARVGRQVECHLLAPAGRHPDGDRRGDRGQGGFPTGRPTALDEQGAAAERADVSAFVTEGLSRAARGAGDGWARLRTGLHALRRAPDLNGRRPRSSGARHGHAGDNGQQPESDGGTRRDCFEDHARTLGTDSPVRVGAVREFCVSGPELRCGVRSLPAYEPAGGGR
jgi:hypothetical protein